MRMVLDLREQDPHDKTVISRVARQLGVGDESLRSWVKRAEVDAGKRLGLTTAEQQELKVLRKENRELRRANDILQAAASFFGAELDRRQKKWLPSSTPTGTERPVGVDGGSSRSVSNSRSPPPPTTTRSPAPRLPGRSVTPSSPRCSKPCGGATTRSTDAAS